MFKPDQTSTLLAHFQSQTPVRASSLVISVWGDSVEPHGGTVWLGSLIKLLEPFGVNERLMRTSIFRLTQDGWLMSDKVGRRSYYSLTGQGRRRFEEAFRRVYWRQSEPWSGSWSLLTVHSLQSEQRKQLLEKLHWLGFGAIGTGLLASPRADISQVRRILSDEGLVDQVVLFETTPQQALAARPERLLVKESWNIDQLGESYARFLSLFRPLWQEIESRAAIDPQSGFIARTLLIHEYRKLVLRDPLLPEELLPGDWSGRAAWQLSRNLYKKLTPAAESWLGEMLETADGPLPELSPGFYRRFQ